MTTCGNQILAGQRCKGVWADWIIYRWTWASAGLAWNLYRFS